MKNLLIPCLVLVSLSVVACNRNKSDAPAVASAAPSAVAIAVASAVPSATVLTAEAVPSASAAALASASAAPAASQVPTQEDFEKKAKTVVSSKQSATQELSRIEKEIGQ
jgi:hypothetical protein